MLEFIKSLFNVPRPAGPPQRMSSFTTSDPTIGQDGITAEGDGSWRIESLGNQTIRLFEIEAPKVDQCIMTYQADLRTQDIRKRTYLEMWCRFPGQGEFFSKGFHHAQKGTNDWSTCQTIFYLKAGQTPDLIKLNVVLEGGGKLWLRNIQLMKTPLK